MISSGRVIDRDGNPIEGATLTPALFISTGPNQDRRGIQATTDADGNWQWDHDKTPGIYAVYVRKQGYLQRSIDFSPPSTFITTLDDAFVVCGTVRDAKGKLIEGAQVTVASNQDYGSPPKSIATTGADGRFTLNDIKQPTVSLRAIGPNNETDFADRVAIPSDDIDFQLVPPKKRTFLVVDSEAQPVLEALVRLASWDRSQAISWATTTNAQGLASWDHAPIGRLVFVTTKEGYCPQWTVVEESEEDDSPIKISMQTPKTLRARVVDDATGEPISSFVVRPQFETSLRNQLPEERWEGNLPESLNQHIFGGQLGVDGKLELKCKSNCDSIKLSIGAIDYVSLHDIVIPTNAIEQPHEFRLRSSRDPEPDEEFVTARVLNADGQPANHAYATFFSHGSSSALPFSPEEILSQQLHQRRRVIRSNDEGVILLPAKAVQIGTLVVWNESGIAFLGQGEFASDASIQLDRYAQVHFRLSPSMTSPLRNLVIEKPLTPQDNLGTVRFNIDDKNRTLEISHARVPAGRLRLLDNRFSLNGPMNHMALLEFDVEPGQRLELDLSGTNTIAGRLTLPDEANLEEPIELQAAVTDAEGRARTYKAMVQPHGTFRFMGVPAGEYIFTIPPAGQGAIREMGRGPMGNRATRSRSFELIYADPLIVVGENQVVDAGEYVAVPSPLH